MVEYRDIIVEADERLEVHPNLGRVWHLWYKNWAVTMVRERDNDNLFLGVFTKADGQPPRLPNIVFWARIYIAGFNVQIRRADFARGQPVKDPDDPNGLKGVYRGEFILLPPGLPRTCSFVLGDAFISPDGEEDPLDWRAVVFP